jgi:hypothetical protein
VLPKKILPLILQADKLATIFLHLQLSMRMHEGTKDDKNYCCRSAAGQAMLLQMHMLAVVF